MNLTQSGQRVASVQDAAGRVTTYGYDASDRITSITDAASRQTKYGYDTNGRLESVIDPAGNETQYSYDASGRLSRVQTMRGVVVDVTYDTAGKVASISRYSALNAGGTKQSTSFTWNAGSTVVTNPLGKTWTHTLDSSGRVTKVVDPMGVQKNQSWTSTSMIASSWESDATAITKFTYDGENNPTKVSMPTGASSSAVYAAGTCGAVTTAGTATDLQQCGVDDAGNQTAFTYDTAGNQTSIQDAKSTDGATISKFYAKPGSTDPNTNCSSFAGQLCSVKDAKGNVTRYLYDSSGNLVKITPPSPLGVVTYTYDSLGRVYSVVKGSGVTNLYEYDVNDQTPNPGGDACGPGARHSTRCRCGTAPDGRSGKIRLIQRTWANGWHRSRCVWSSRSWRTASAMRTRSSTNHPCCSSDQVRSARTPSPR